MASFRLIYRQELLKQAPYGLKSIGITVKCENKIIENLMNSVLSSLGCNLNGEIILSINENGTEISANSGGTEYEYEKLLAVCCLNEMRNGRDIAVPYDAPGFLDALALDCGKKVYRYLSTPADNSDSLARRLAAKQVFVRDGLFLAVKLLSVMKEKECTLEELIAELPEKYIIRKTVHIGFSPADIAGLVGEEDISLTNDFEGIKLKREKGKLLIIPERSGDKVRILAEADTMEAATELCEGIEELFKNI